MSKKSITRFEFGQFINAHPRYTYGLFSLVALVVAVGLFFAFQKNKLPGSAWLPDAATYTSDTEVLWNLPVKTDNVITRYGRAVRYTTTTSWQPEDSKMSNQPWTTIYEFNASASLKPSACPNVANVESLSPTGCDKLGELQGSPVYAINRSLPSGTTEYFVTLDGIFIYVRSGGDGVKSLSYLQSFRKLSRGSVATYLATNTKKVEQVRAKQHAEKVAANRNSALAYTRLQFTPVLAGQAPEGWGLSGNDPKRITIDGPDAVNPTMFSTSYSYKDNSAQTVRWHVRKLSDFKLGPTCGPTPGYNMKDLDCYKVPGTNYYEAILYDESNDFVRHTYYPVGDSVVITQIVAHPDGSGQRPGWPTELVKAQDLLTASAKPVKLAELKGSSFDQLYYY